ncbi:hypothetical protein Molly5_122 [Maribacter phage Molly_5]|uniref:Uncharacterized protein n=1 Tax=Maribacter phage Molly_1 TaxID=2745685 RepID=A0A8E4XXX2_9CAUD|nr:hypothetical protein M1M29_gp121 [Maribacter phage Molly_1]QQO97613.1 hypothetical protein Molly2_121 [Maribacter phage Molly_2]QQO97813.1 hypothetical protein Molly3_121 [Maribacter phage Molly_3]QQO98014.1 hypothetical protein Molly4_122 [Maribacter phage Molly_4]QQO98214.1 hypothetical protein Molly5_122 [Maribacter phage Molly_5]QQO97413.1 hypothetical protein Molly1_121 [Maribacter phage Molly_1]
MNTSKEKSLIERVLERTLPFAKKVSYECSSSVYGPEDIFQELQIEQIKRVNKITDLEEKTETDLVYICLSEIRLYRLYAFRHNNSIKDRADRAEDFTSTHEYSNVSFKSPEQEYLENDLFERVETRIAHLDKKYEGIQAFFDESRNPSFDTLDKFEAYKTTVSNPRNCAAGNIPPSVLAKLMDITPRRLLTYKTAIGHALAYEGVPERTIRTYFNY